MAHVTFTPAPVDSEPYDEFAFLPDVAAEIDREWTGSPAPTRRGFELAGGQTVSLIQWGDGPPDLVFLHGGGQNGRTWDSVVIALGRTALAIDLPGHGRSDRRSDRDYGPWESALAVAEVIEAVAADAAAVIGMSLGGATAIRLAATRPDLTRRAVIVDVTPQVNDPGRAWTPEQRGSVALLGGPPTYDSFEEMAAATIALSPKRTESAVRRGVRNNAVRLADGRWMWRSDLFARSEDERRWTDFTSLWDDVSAITVPTMLVLGGDSIFVLPEDREQFTTRLPATRVEVVPGAGHAVQSDQPLALSALIADFVGSGR